MALLTCSAEGFLFCVLLGCFSSVLAALLAHLTELWRNRMLRKNVPDYITRDRFRIILLWFYSFFSKSGGIRCKGLLFFLWKYIQIYLFSYYFMFCCFLFFFLIEYQFVYLVSGLNSLQQNICKSELTYNCRHVGPCSGFFHLWICRDKWVNLLAWGDLSVVRRHPVLTSDLMQITLSDRFHYRRDRIVVFFKHTKMLRAAAVHHLAAFIKPLNKINEEQL